MPPIRPTSTCSVSSTTSEAEMNQRELSPMESSRASTTARTHPYPQSSTCRGRRSSVDQVSPLMTEVSSCFSGPPFTQGVAVPSAPETWSSASSSSADSPMADDLPELSHSATSTPNDFPSPARFTSSQDPESYHGMSARRLQWHDVNLLSEAFEYAREPPAGSRYASEIDEDEEMAVDSTWYPVDQLCEAGPSRSTTPHRAGSEVQERDGRRSRNERRENWRRSSRDDEHDRDEHSASPRSRRTSSKQKEKGVDVKGHAFEGLRLSGPRRTTSMIEGVYDPPKLPLCKLDIHFAESEQDVDIPPAFYAGAAIPTLLNLVIDRYTCLPHHLNPRLTMALTGTLHLGVQTRNIISVSVSLAEGLVLWSRDAVEAHKRDVPRELAPFCDPARALPGGRYSLPLTVQIPNTKLPPTYDTPNGRFSVTYALSVVLTCDNPDPVKAAKGEVVTLATVARPFHLLPVTMPDEAPQLDNMAYWTRSEESPFTAGVGRFGAIKRLNSRWLMSPSIPTSTYSPTSTIPVSLKFTSYATTSTTALVRLTVMQRQRIITVLPAPSPTSSSSNDMISETPVCTRFGVFELSGQNRTTELKGMELPLMVGESWKHGFSTKLDLPEDEVTGMPEVKVANDLYVLVEVGFPTTSLNAFFRTYLPGQAIPAMNTLSPAKASSPLSRAALVHCFPGKVKTTEIPLFIGSVSEPRDAMHWVRWSDLMVEQEWVEGERRERARMINGGALSCENGWLVAPPSYEEAIHVQDRRRSEGWVDIIRSV